MNRNRASKIPQIQLETDIEGLMQLQESRKPPKAPLKDNIPPKHMYENSSPMSSNTITVPNMKRKSLKRVQYSEIDETRSVISFDACVISEQVTTV